MSLGLSGDMQTDFCVATDQIYRGIHFNSNSFSSRKMSLELSGDVYNDIDGAFDQLLPMGLL